MLSLIVPVYNVVQYLDRCVSSILAQTYSQFELILVDDGSSDGSSKLCDLYEKQDDRIKVIHKENGGLVSARKKGVVAAKGEYIGFVDGDDWIEPEMYEHLINAAIEYQADMVLGGCIEDVNGQNIDKVNQIMQGVYDKKRLQEEVYPYMLCMEDFLKMGVQPYTCNKLIRHKLAVDHIMTVDDRICIGEDVAVVISALLHADKVVITDYCDYHYCIRGASMMWQYGNAEKELENLCILHKFLQTVFKQYIGQYKLEEQLAHYTVGNILTRVYDRFAKKDGDEYLWPFAYQIGRRKCVVYSAGNFGRQVYGYLHEYYPECVSLWVDREYQRYQSMGLPVYSVNDIVEQRESDILIAVLDLQLARAIRENLVHFGLCNGQIYSIHIGADEVREILNSM